MLRVTLPGTGGMMPTKERWLSTCIISCEGHSILIDCGEGTQVAVKFAGCRIKPVDLICITHFHADHISGLPGFLLSLGNEGRVEPLTIAGPKGIKRIVKSLCVIAPALPFEIRFRELTEPEPFEEAGFTVTPFKVRHRVECLGYSFYLPRIGKFNVEKARALSIPQNLWNPLQKTGQVMYNDKLYTYDMVSDGDREGIKVTYCTDTRPVNSIIENAKNSDLFICEGLYYSPDKLERAKLTGHMLYEEAAELAVKASVKRLWLTHFSPAVEFPEEGISAAADIFENAECGFDGKTIDLVFND